MTFHAFARGSRLQRAFTQLRHGAVLDEVALSHGYESHSGFRDAFGKTIGQAPGRSRSSPCVMSASLDSPLGPLVAAVTDRGVCLLEYGDRDMLPALINDVKQRFGPLLQGSHPLLDRLRAELGEYFAGTRHVFDVPIDAPGSPFHVRVWNALREIPYGQTRSYTQVARAVGAPSAQRAVGRANGLNRIAILTPCHRVVTSSGGLGGYGGGVWRKRYLLELERNTTLTHGVTP
jgi:AraC family transcriptional regulator of adaptative response/methylated-DNA-[protein]-cysteine methyltransferase